MEVKVFFIKNCYKFCIDGMEVKFENILDVLEGKKDLDPNAKCRFENPLYTFNITGEEGSASDTLTLELILVKTKDKNVEADSIVIFVSKNENQEYRFKVNQQEAICKDILLLLVGIIEAIIISISIRELLEKDEQKVEYQQLK